MPGFNKKKESKELKITKCKHPKGYVDVVMSKFKTPKNIKSAQNKRCTLSMCEQSLCKV